MMLDIPLQAIPLFAGQCHGGCSVGLAFADPAALPKAACTLTGK
jgi:hypothetical protein